jgi:N-ethylmaleimide reductase
MPSLFDALQVGRWRLPNRIVMAPLTRNRAPDAIPTPLMAEYYAQRASAGLLISEATAISQQGQGYAHVPGLYSTEQLDGWRRVTDAVHKRGGRIVCQLWHVGRISHVDLQPEHQAPVAPSAITAKTTTFLIYPDGTGKFVPVSEPRELDASEIPGLVHDFRHAARFAVASAGFDGVELHGANGYLIDQFLKTGTNKRSDDYGGPIENRARFLLEVMRTIVEEIGGDRVGLRLAPVTPANDIDDEDPQRLFDYVMRELAPLKLAYIHVVEGATSGPREVQGRPFDYRAMRWAYRDAGGEGAWMVNNGYDRGMAESAIESGDADLVAFGRPYISNPDLVERFRSNTQLADSHRATYYGGGAQGYTDYPATVSKATAD